MNRFLVIAALIAVVIPMRAQADMGLKEPLINLRIMAHCAFDSGATVWTWSCPRLTGHRAIVIELA